MTSIGQKFVTKRGTGEMSSLWEQEVAEDMKRKMVKMMQLKPLKQSHNQKNFGHYTKTC